jgi:hypothetical protein
MAAMSRLLVRRTAKLVLGGDSAAGPPETPALEMAG